MRLVDRIILIIMGISVAISFVYSEYVVSFISFIFGILYSMIISHNKKWIEFASKCKWL